MPSHDSSTARQPAEERPRRSAASETARGETTSSQRRRAAAALGADPSPIPDSPSAAGEPYQGARVFEGEAPSAVRDIRDSLVIKEGDLFFLTDLLGNVPLGNPNGLGLYYQDTRFLSSYELVIQGLQPTILLSTGRSHFFAAQVLTNPNLVTATGEIVHEQTIQIRRYRLLRQSEASESITFENFNVFPVTLNVSLHLEADFADIFEIRGLVKSRERGKLWPAEYHDGALLFCYDGRDGIRRVTRVRLDPAPTHVAGGTASYQIELPARGAARLATTIQLGQMPTEDGQPPDQVPPIPAQVQLSRYREWLDQQTSIETSNALFNNILLQARYDLRVLLSTYDGIPFPVAGIPWYATLFGRDSLITALNELWLSTRLARDTLRLLARFQGQHDDPWQDEEPGKIMHELRRGELANLGLVPFAPYYGTVDATPLWVLLLAEYYRATADLDLVRELLPNLDAALRWIDQFGDADRDGFVEYRRRSPSGLANQGWKDSWDGIVHRDGSLAEPPIALVEVQAYVYAAKRGAARLYRALGQPQRAEQLEREAAQLREAFNEAFWMPEERFYCLALDGKKQQVKAIASNAGHALWCGIVPEDRAGQVAQRLMAEDLFSGWGIRTLSSREVRYNPVGYHLGTVWPHDNALIALGLKRYGQDELVHSLATGLADAAQHFPSYRMPELFCGFARSAFGVPVRYPVACSPQAWAATSWSALLQSMLCVQANAPARELFIARPSLPPWLQWVHVNRIPVGDGEVDLRYERVQDRTAVDVVAMRGNVRVTFVETWQ